MARASIRSRVKAIPVLPMKRDGVEGIRMDLRLIVTPDRFYVTGLNEDGTQATESREPMEFDRVPDFLSYLVEAGWRLMREGEETNE